MITWGISANSHDAALAVFVDNELVFASHSERFSGIKNDPDLHKDLVEYARQWGYPNKVVWYENPYKKTLRQFLAGQGFNYERNNIKHYLSTWGIHCPIVYVNHHDSHVAGGYFTSNFTSAACVSIDAIGEFETLTIWKARSKKLKRVYSQRYANSE